jgi:hypothetical protein
MPDVVQFELYLLSQMRANDKVRAALAALGVDAAVMHDTAEHVGLDVGLTRVGHGIDLYPRILGQPLEITTEPEIDSNSGFADSQRLRFHLPVWNSFDFIVRAHREGWAWGPEFVRRHGEQPPSMTGIREMEPWTLLESEVWDRLGPFKAEYPFNFSNEVVYRLDAPPQPSEDVSLLFDFKLFQGIEVRTPSVGATSLSL